MAGAGSAVDPRARREAAPGPGFTGSGVVTLRSGVGLCRKDRQSRSPIPAAPRGGVLAADRWQRGSVPMAVTRVAFAHVKPAALSPLNAER